MKDCNLQRNTTVKLQLRWLYLYTLICNRYYTRKQLSRTWKGFTQNLVEFHNFNFLDSQIFRYGHPSAQLLIHQYRYVLKSPVRLWASSIKTNAPFKQNSDLQREMKMFMWKFIIPNLVILWNTFFYFHQTWIYFFTLDEFTLNVTLIPKICIIGSSSKNQTLN